MAPLGSPLRSLFCSLRVGTTPTSSPRQSMQSLGTGGVSPDGSITFCGSPKEAIAANHQEDRFANPSTVTKVAVKFLRKSSSFLRVADLDMDVSTSITTQDSEESQPNFHHPSSDPPPGVEHDPKEQWIALNDCEGIHAPIAPIAVDRLADFGLTTCLNTSMWTPDTKTDRILKRDQCANWMKQTFGVGRVRMIDQNDTSKDVLVWSGNFKHGFYGSDLPAIRVAGIIGMSAKALMELLVDSSRVQEYNKMSLGRTDLQIFQQDMSVRGPFGHSVTKVMKSETKPPLLRKTLVLVSILHARELVDGSGYLIVTRAVHHPGEQGSSGALTSEILIGVNLIRKVHGAEDSQCLMINVQHIRPPIVSPMLAKRLAVSASVGFINDIRAMC